MKDKFTVYDLNALRSALLQRGDRRPLWLRWILLNACPWTVSCLRRVLCLDDDIVRQIALSDIEVWYSFAANPAGMRVLTCQHYNPHLSIQSCEERSPVETAFFSWRKAPPLFFRFGIRKRDLAEAFQLWFKRFSPRHSPLAVTASHWETHRLTAHKTRSCPYALHIRSSSAVPQDRNCSSSAISCAVKPGSPPHAPPQGRCRRIAGSPRVAGGFAFIMAFSSTCARLLSAIEAAAHLGHASALSRTECPLISRAYSCCCAIINLIPEAAPHKFSLKA